MLSPVFRYSYSRDAYVLRVVGSRVGPVLRAERRVRRHRAIEDDRRQPSTA
jgi:hypothetical protein